MLADVLGRTLVPVDVPAASGLGAALLGARAAGLADAFPFGTAPAETRTSPGARQLDLYRDRHAAFRRKVHALRNSDSTTAGSSADAIPHSAAPVSG